jgi:hypothetical protein
MLRLERIRDIGEVLPDLPHRQFVFTMPKALRACITRAYHGLRAAALCCECLPRASGGGVWRRGATGAEKARP